MVTTVELPASPNGREVIRPETRAVWRAWLAAHPDRTEGVWVVYRKKSSALTGPLYDDLVEEALCFGWIDSVARQADGGLRIQWFSPRRRGGIWSALNKRRIVALEAAGLMAEPGRAAIARAQADGSWSQTDEVDALVVPPDLERALAATPGGARAWAALADSEKRLLLWPIYSAKREATRAARVAVVVRRCAPPEDAPPEDAPPADDRPEEDPLGG